jgi:ABC-2 type transport system permease protein
MSTVYLLTLRQLSGKWRLLVMSVLAALPVLMAVLVLSFDDAPTVVEFEAITLNSILAGSILPMVVLAIAGAAFSNEVEDRTLANLTLAPIERWQITVPKLLATITLSAPFIAVSAFLTSHVAFLADWRATIAVVVASLVGVALYSAAFVWLGLVTNYAIGIGLTYIVLWEGLFSRFVSGFRLLSVRYYSIGLMHGIDERRFAEGTHLPFIPLVVLCLVVFSLFLYMAVRRLKRMDVP